MFFKNKEIGLRRKKYMINGFGDWFEKIFHVTLNLPAVSYSTVGDPIM
jgi:hypothetical protein